MKLRILIFIYCSSFVLPIYSQECYVAKLKKEIDSLSFITSELDTAIIHSGEKFIVFRDHWTDKNVEVWTNKGDFIHKVDSNYIEIIPNEVAFKMVTNKKKLFRISCSERAIERFQKFNINICELVKLASNHDFWALKRVFSLINIVNHDREKLLLSSIIWNLLHLYDDEEFSLFLKGINKKLKNEIALYITSPHVPILDYKIHYLSKAPVPPPVTNTRTYFKTNYPKTWKIIKKKRYRNKDLSITH